MYGLKLNAIGQYLPSIRVPRILIREYGIQENWWSNYNNTHFRLFLLHSISNHQDYFDKKTDKFLWLTNTIRETGTKPKFLAHNQMIKTSIHGPSDKSILDQTP